MLAKLGALSLLVTACLAFAVTPKKPGVQIRLTKKGLKYLATVGRGILEAELQKVTFDEKGSADHLTYQIYGASITGASFPAVQLTPESKIGIKAAISGAMLAASGKISYRYKRGIIKFSGHFGFEVKIKGVDIAAAAKIGATTEGGFTISMPSCNGHISSIDIKFTGSWQAFILNLFRPLLEKKIKGKLNAEMCNILRKQVEETLRRELETFPVVAKLDKWAEIDYRLTEQPVYTTNYMDVFSKGQFKSTTQHSQDTKLVPSEFKTSSDHGKMIYIWVSEYTVNTAGEVYQRSKQLNVTAAEWDKKVPDEIRKKLFTAVLQPFIPNLIKYPNLPMSVEISSRKAPKVIMKENNVHLFLYADAVFSAKQKDGKLIELFVFKIETDAKLNVKIQSNKVVGDITDFNYDAAVLKSDIGDIDVSLFTSPFVKMIVENMVKKKANEQLAKGFPLPQLDHVELDGEEVMLMENVIRIGTDINYKQG